VEPKNIYVSDGLRILPELSNEPIALDKIADISW
jgi:hypothetical protein